VQEGGHRACGARFGGFGAGAAHVIGAREAHVILVSSQSLCLSVSFQRSCLSVSFQSSCLSLMAELSELISVGELWKLKSISELGSSYLSASFRKLISVCELSMLKSVGELLKLKSIDKLWWLRGCLSYGSSHSTIQISIMYNQRRGKINYFLCR